MLAAAAQPPPPPPSPAAVAHVITGSVACDRCPAGDVWVAAYPAVDRYHWPWWDVYGFLQLIHSAGALDAMRPAPLAAVKLDRPGRFRLELATAGEAYLFALLDGDGSGLATGATRGDRVARFPRNPVRGDASDLSLVLEALPWDPEYARHRYAVPAAAPPGIRFTDVTAASGIDFRHCQGGDLGHLPVVVGSGALLDDLDGDGDLDLVAVQGLGECPGSPAASRLYLNDGRGRFRDAGDDAGLGPATTGMGVVAADYDQDGDLDLYLTSLQGGRLLRNDGHARFTDVTALAGVGDAGRWPVGASFGDVDGDGRLDLFVANYVDFSGSPPFVADAEIPGFLPAMLSSPFAFPAQPDRLYLGRPGGRFVEAEDALGAADPEGKGMSAVLADLDQDGDLDLYVTNDCTSDRVFVNRGGRLEDATAVAGVGDVSSGMGIALGDLDGDGLADLFSPHWLNEPVVLYRNRSTRDHLRFEEGTVPAGLAGAGGLTGWAADLLDVDRDGDLDLLVSNGHTHPGRDPGTLEAQPLQLFRNDGKGRFEDASAALAAAVGGPRVWRGAALGDVDGDGDVDLFLVAWNGPPALLANQSAGGHWLHVRLARRSGERGAIGARVRIEAGGRSQVREVVTGTSYLSHSSLECEFGLGAARRVDRIEVTWPGGARERFPASAADRTVTLLEGAGTGGNAGTSAGSGVRGDRRARQRRAASRD